MHVLEIPVTDEEFALLDARGRAAGLPGGAAYLREMIRRDLAAASGLAPAAPKPSLDEVLAPLREEVRASGITEEELDTLFDAALKEVRAERRREEAISTPEDHAAPFGRAVAA